MSEGWVRATVGAFHLDVAWRVSPGEVLVLFGPSGAGKTMTLRAIAGLLRPREGRIQVGGGVVFDRNHGWWVPPHHRKVGYVPQHYGLFPHLRVRENIAYGLRPRRASSVMERVAELVETLRLEDVVGKYPNQISAGQQQRVALARSLAPKPELLLLDEPFSALDAELRRSLRAELRALLEAWSIPIILVTHDREDVLALGNRVQVMDSGRVVVEGDPVEVLGQPPTSLVARLAGVENLYDGRVVSRSPQDGTMVCRIGDASLEVPLAELDAGDAVTVGLRARDVILATQWPQGLSARNILPGHIVSLEGRSPGVQVVVECGALIVRSQVTQEAVRELDLVPGKRIWVVVKASSCFLVRG